MTQTTAPNDTNTPTVIPAPAIPILSPHGLVADYASSSEDSLFSDVPDNASTSPDEDHGGRTTPGDEAASSPVLNASPAARPAPPIVPAEKTQAQEVASAEGGPAGEFPYRWLVS